MATEPSEEPRAWNDNHPWLQQECVATDDDDDLRLPGQKLQIRWVFQTANFSVESGDKDTVYFRGLAYDRDGNFYGVTEADPHHYATPPRSMVRKLAGKAALTWFAQHASWDEAFTRELCRAINNPAFEFMSLVPTRAPAKRQRRRKGKAAEAFHEQLLMATALVECVRKLEDAPSVENLADACRSAAVLHQAIHRPENFKLAAQG